MIDIHTQTPITLNQARRLPYLKGRAGNAVSLDSLHRWASRGVRGVVLQTFRIGGSTRFTTAEAVYQFIEQLNSDRLLSPRPTISRQHEIQAANKRLDEKGI